MNLHNCYTRVSHEKKEWTREFNLHYFRAIQQPKIGTVPLGFSSTAKISAGIRSYFILALPFPCKLNVVVALSEFLDNKLFNCRLPDTGQVVYRFNCCVKVVIFGRCS